MPLDGHEYLVRQGWSGKGTGLRQGGIARPLAIPQKRTLAGLGKDRDEAFPFWDHLYAAAAKSIKIKVGDDEESGSTSDSAAEITEDWKRTKTGIFSNRRPLTDDSGTPDVDDPQNSRSPSSLSLVAVAKREAAKRGLYAVFFRGPVLRSEDGWKNEGVREADLPTAHLPSSIAKAETRTSMSVVVRVEVKEKKRKREGKKRDETEEERAARKKRRREDKKAQKLAAVVSKSAVSATVDMPEAPVSAKEVKGNQKDGETKEERRKRKEEKRRMKAAAERSDDPLGSPVIPPAAEQPSTSLENPTPRADEAGAKALHKALQTKRKPKKAGAKTKKRTTSDP